MLIQRLNLARFRSFETVEFSPEPGINLITGSNGAGKTTLIEAAHLLANGRSFRGRVRDGLIKHGEADLEVFAQWSEGSGRVRQAGLRHSGRAWEARVDSQPVSNLAELCAALAVLSFEPGSHELIAGGSEQRRQFLDWALFHVEPDFLPIWRRCARALKQRNALLKSRPHTDQLTPWDQELADAGESVTRMRALYLSRFEPILRQISERYLPELGPLRLEFLPGWRRETQSLAEALAASRERDLLFGHGVTGPHRANWQIEFDGLPARNALSRGQQKLVALSCVLAQASAYAELRHEWPIIALDDLSSELDEEHQRRVLVDLASNHAQIFLTGTETPRGLSASGIQPTVFHVEQGKLRPLL